MKRCILLLLSLLLALCLCAGPAAAEGEEDWSDPRKTAVEVTNESRTIDGNISVQGKDTYVTGLLVSEDQGEAVEVTLNGAVTAAAETDHLDHQDCTAVSVNAAGEGSGVAAELNGNISATNVWTAGEKMNLDNGALSVWAGDGGKTDVTVNGDIYADAKLLPEGEDGYTWSAGVGAYTGGTGADAAVTVNGNVTASADCYSVGINANNEDTGTVSVQVNGDVEAGSLGIRAINWNEESRIDITVDGTVKQSEDGISLEGTCPENITLTVWQAEETARGHIVSVDGEMSEEQAAEAEKAIQYIIRTDGGSAEYITTDAREYNGYRVANEGETVTLQVDVPDSYRIRTVRDGQTALAKNADGNWVMQMPRGGGVELFVDMDQQISLFRSADTAQIAALKTALADSLPAEALALLPDGEYKVSDTATLKLTCPVPAALSSDTPVTLKAARAFTEGEKALVMLALPAKDKTEWLFLEGAGTADGRVQVMLSPDQIRQLDYQVFLAVIL